LNCLALAVALHRQHRILTARPVFDRCDGTRLVRDLTIALVIVRNVMADWHAI
jgi:hypothetical protein